MASTDHMHGLVHWWDQRMGLMVNSHLREPDFCNPLHLGNSERTNIWYSSSASGKPRLKDSWHQILSSNKNFFKEPERPLQDKKSNMGLQRRGNKSLGPHLGENWASSRADSEGAGTDGHAARNPAAEKQKTVPNCVSVILLYTFI